MQTDEAKIGLAAGVLFLAGMLALMAGCAGAQKLAPWVASLPVQWATNAVPVVVAGGGDKPVAGGLVPVKLAHGKPSPLRSPETPDSSSERTVDGVAFRIYELDSDKPIGRQAVKAQAIRVIDGMTVIDDFMLDSGQVAVWEYTNDGKDKGPIVRDNPAKLRNDSRIRYRCYEAAK